jgi:hypothetical protein
MMRHPNYTRLSLLEVTRELEGLARDVESTFGRLDAQQLNWKPDATRWSVAQCFEHLLIADRLMLQSAEDALRAGPRNLWQRVPLLPRLWGRMLIKSQSPNATRRFRAPERARPTASKIAADIIKRFVEHRRTSAEWMRALREPDAARAIMLSPFISVATYSVLDGCRLIVAHDRRHFEQAQRVMLCERTSSN